MIATVVGACGGARQGAVTGTAPVSSAPEVVRYVAAASASVAVEPVLPRCPDFDEASARGRALAGRGEWAKAELAFDEAIRARPLDARTWLERVRVRRKLGTASIDEIVFAQSLTGDRALLAALFVEEVPLHEALGDVDGARIALASAAALGSEDAAKALGNASRCTATWTTELEGVESPIAKSWRDVASRKAFLNCDVDVPVAKSESEARLIACQSCEDGKAGPNACTGSPPWVVPAGYMNFHLGYFVIEPLPKGRFYVESGLDVAEGSPRRVEGDLLAVDEVRSTEARGAFHDDDATMLSDGGIWCDQLPQGDDANAPPPCKADTKTDRKLGFVIAGGMATAMLPLAETRRTYFDLASGRPLLRVDLRLGDVAVRREKGELVIARGGCDARIPIAKPKPKKK